MKITIQSRGGIVPLVAFAFLAFVNSKKETVYDDNDDLRDDLNEVLVDGEVFGINKVDRTDSNVYFKANTSFLIRQRAILQAFRHYRCPSLEEHQDFYLLSQTYNPKHHLKDYKYPDLVNEYVTNLEAGKYLSRFEQYPNRSDDSSDQMTNFAQIISSTFDTSADLFYKTMAYFYTRINVSILYWGVTFAVSSTKTEGYRLPPPYEVLPTFSVPKDIIHQLNTLDRWELTKSYLNPVVIRSRTGMGLPEEKMAYFREDASINAFHFFWHVDFPYWFDKAVYGFSKERKGELFMHMHHQVMNRYHAQRISLQFPNIDPINLTGPLNPGYFPNIVTTDFKEYPSRAPGIFIQNLSSIKVTDLKLYESRILDAVRQGYLVNSTSTISIRNDGGNEILGAALESSVESVNSKLYDSLHNNIHYMVSFVSDATGELNLPLGLQIHPEISMADPIFFKTHLFIDNFNKLELDYLTPYTQLDLDLPGVTIKSLKVQSHRTNSRINELQTYFHNVSWDITNAISDCRKQAQISKAQVYSSVAQLDHSDFTYKIQISSDKNRDAVVRIFMTPTDYYNDTKPNLDKFRWSFFEMDKVFVKLTKGNNVISRDSKDSSLIVPRYPSWKSMNDRINIALKLNKPLLINKNTRHCGWPQHYLLPQGRVEGMQYKLFAMVTDFKKDFNVDFETARRLQSLSLCNVVKGKTPDQKPMGFPFERKIISWGDFLTKNMILTDVTIKHVKEEKKG